MCFGKKERRKEASWPHRDWQNRVEVLKPDRAGNDDPRPKNRVGRNLIGMGTEPQKR